MNQLGILAKYWQPGLVKTRLAAAIGPESAARLHQEFLGVLLSRFGGLAQRRELVFWPSDRRQEFAALAGPRWELAFQGDGNLGARMQSWFERAFSEGATGVVLIGADSPTLPVEYVEQAFAALAHAPVVLGPADDGGYYLVGGSGGPPQIFANINWGTPAVWGQTIERLAAANRSWHELPPWYDIDTVADLERLRAELAGGCGNQEEWERLRSILSDLARKREQPRVDGLC